jgi:hypothetical protein
MARPKASMAEGYIQDEYLGLLLNTYIGLMLWNDEYGMLMKKMEMLVRYWKVWGENFTWFLRFVI